MIEIRLRELLAARRESLAEVARATGLSYSTLHRLCSGRANRVDLATLEALCTYFDRPPGDLLDWSDGTSEIDRLLTEKIRRGPETLTRIKHHLAEQEAKFGIQPDSLELIRTEREKRERQLADLP